MSGSIRRYNRVVPEYAQSELKPGVRLDPGPHIGVVKANIDPLRKGRLSVFIEGFGGNENDESQWLPVRYSSPFFGQTTDTGKSVENNFDNTNHSYGMWFTPPDLGVRVLCTFVKGDPNQGFYFGCLPDQHNHHAVPGHAASENIVSDDLQRYNKSKLPAAEYNDRNEQNRHQNYKKNLKPANPYLSDQLVSQGLIEDETRGLTSSSSKRETPSRVVGFSTPGSPDPEVVVDSNQSTTEASSQKIPPTKVRKPGHQLVLDDGDAAGNNKLVRLKTSTGHQILMHDTAGVIYVATADGNSWIQMSNSGKIDVFSSDSISFHSQKDINFLAEENINLHANKSVKMYSKEKASIESADSVEVLTTQNVKITTTEGKMFVNSESQTVQPLPQQIYDNTIFDTEKNEWVVEELPQDEKKTSIGSRVPEHEPSPTHRSV
jgi:hypothetical protein